MTSFRFIHTADIHLDSPLKGLAGYDGPAVECIRTATRQAFDNLMSEAIDQKVDFVVIAGDLYDGDWRDYQTGLFFARQMGRLAKASIPTFVLYGNHDAESQIARRLSMPDGVNVFSTRKPETFTLMELGVALHGQSFRQRDVTDNLATTYPEPVAGVFNIGVLHTGMGGMGGHAICLSNNAAERALRGIALGRKSWLFCGSDRGGQRAAAMYSLIVTAKMNDIDPQVWLADVLSRIATHPAHRLDELLPWNWAKRTGVAQAA